MHDRIATTVNLAKSIRMGLDKSTIETPVQTETLRLLLDTLIDLGTPPAVQKVAEGASRTVLGRVTAIDGVADRGRRGR